MSNTTIKAAQSGKKLDEDLKAFYDTMTTDNSGLIMYIRNGELALDTEENLFTLATWEDE